MIWIGFLVDLWKFLGRSLGVPEVFLRVPQSFLSSLRVPYGEAFPQGFLRGSFGFSKGSLGFLAVHEELFSGSFGGPCGFLGAS